MSNPKQQSTDNPNVLIVAPSIRIMGGQAVNALQLLRDLKLAGFQVEFQAINPQLPGSLAPLERIKYVRTLFVSFFYLFELLRNVPRFDVIHIFSASYLSFIISQMPAILVSKFIARKSCSIIDQANVMTI